MGMYLMLNTNGDAALRSEILGYGEAEIARVKEIEAQYFEILNDQMREDWSAQYAAYQAALGATTALAVASAYESAGFGKIRAHEAVKSITADQGCGSCSGSLAVYVLEAQVADFEKNHPHDVRIDALVRAITAAKAGRLPGVSWC